MRFVDYRKTLNMLDPSAGFKPFNVLSVKGRPPYKSPPLHEQTLSFSFGTEQNYVWASWTFGKYGSLEATRPDLDCDMHVIETESIEAAEDMAQFFDMATGSPSPSDTGMIHEQPSKTDRFDTRAIAERRRERETWRLEKLRQLSSPATIPSKYLRYRPPRRKDTRLERLPEEVRQLIFQYAIEIPFCGCLFCCDAKTMRYLLNLSQTSRDSLIATVRVHGNHAMRYFAGLAPVRSESRDDMLEKIESYYYSYVRCRSYYVDGIIRARQCYAPGSKKCYQIDLDCEKHRSGRF